MSRRRIWAIVLQNLYSMRRTPIRIMDLLYWPLLQVVLWGFITRFLVARQADLPGGVTVLLGAVVLWDVLQRTQQELALTGITDMWDRNVLNLYASPLRQSEYVLGGLLYSFGRVVVGTLVLVVVARLAFGLDLLEVGPVLVLALLILVAMGWAMGIGIRAMVLRFGSSADVLTWSAVVALQPVAAVFYPVDVLPAWLQVVARLVPASYVFEALRALFATGVAPLGGLAIAAGLDILYVGIAALLLGRAARAVRDLGLLTRPGY
jgi:ABC-2 type transport system permease protein